MMELRPEHFGLGVRAVVKKRVLRANGVALSTGLTERGVGKIMSLETMPSLASMLKLSEHLELSIDQIMLLGKEYHESNTGSLGRLAI